MQARVEELAGRLSAAADRAASAIAAGAGAGAGAGAAVPGGPPGQDAPDPEEQEALRQALAEAAPIVTGAGEFLARATEKISGSRFADALGAESAAGEALAQAQERFFDLRQLLDRTYEDEQRVAALSASEESEAEALRQELAPGVVDLQAINLGRAERLQILLDREGEKRISALEAQAAEAGGGAPPQGAPPYSADQAAPDPLESERQRFEIANQLLALAEGAMLETRAALGDGDAEDAPDWPAVGLAATRSAEHLDAMRTLFFTLAEHVRKLALDQVDFRDQSQEALALANASPSDETEARADALAPEQRALETRGGAIADALLAQAESMPLEEDAPGDAGAVFPDEEGGDGEAEDEADSDPTSGMPSRPAGSADERQPESERDRIRRAAEHVALAQLAMG